MVVAVVILGLIAIGLAIAIVCVLCSDYEPARAPARPPDEPLALHPAYPVQRWRILVVDNNPLIGRCVTRLLDGHDVAMATSGEAALSALAIDDDRDAILCALDMPGMSGPAFAAAIAQRHPALHARIVFLINGSATRETRTLLTQSKVRCVTKPIAYVQLATCVSEVAAAA